MRREIPWWALAVVATLAVACGSADPEPRSASLVRNVGGERGAASDPADPPSASEDAAEREVPDDAEEVDIADVEVGQCFFEPTRDLVDALATVPCEDPHEYELYALVDLEGGEGAEYPGDEAIGEDAFDVCEDRFEDFVGVAYDDSRYYIFTISPSEETWDDGDREVVCALYEPVDAEEPDGEVQLLNGSLEGTAA